MTCEPLRNVRNSRTSMASVRWFCRKCLVWPVENGRRALPAIEMLPRPNREVVASAACPARPRGQFYCKEKLPGSKPGVSRKHNVSTFPEAIVRQELESD